MRDPFDGHGTHWAPESIDYRSIFGNLNSETVASEDAESVALVNFFLEPRWGNFVLRPAGSTKHEAKRSPRLTPGVFGVHSTSRTSKVLLSHFARVLIMPRRKSCSVGTCLVRAADRSAHRKRDIRDMDGMPESDPLARKLHYSRHFEQEQQMSHPAVILLVRFKSSLSLEEVRNVAEERAPDFSALPGLQQKYYLQDAATGEYAGLYLWESPDSLAVFRDSELRASIAKAYETHGEPRVEVYTVLKALRDACC